MAAHPARLAELLGALSAVSDLARGHAVDEATRSCLVATGLARRVGLSTPEVADVYYTSLLRSVGCTATSHEIAALMGGDDIAVRARGDMVDMSRPGEAAAFIAGMGRGLPPARRLRAVAGTAALGKRAAAEGAHADCEVGAAIARRLRLPATVEAALLDVFERWDGRGGYRGLAGDAIAAPARFAAVGLCAAMFAGEPEGAATAVRRWRGCALDPALADGFLASADELLGRGRRRGSLARGRRVRARAAANGHARGDRRARPGLRGRRRPEGAVPARPLGRRRGARRARGGAGRMGGAACSTCAARRSCTTSAGPRSRPASGRNRPRSRSRSGSRCGCTPTTASASSGGRRRSRRWPPRPACTTSARTGADTTAASPERPSRARPGSWRPPTPTTP